MNYDWTLFLARWSKELLASENVEYYQLPFNAIASGWLGYPGAADEQLASAESRLGRVLPTSYREFLKVTNGWSLTGTCCVDKWWSASEIDWYYIRHANVVNDWIEGEQRSGGPLPDEAYFVYGEAQTNMIRAEYLKAALEITDVSEGSVYLLNPQVVNSDGEWEAWFFADWLPGAERYPSFWELMQGEHKKFKRQEGREAKRYRPDDLSSLPDKVPGLIEELLNEIQQWNQITANHAPEFVDIQMYDKGVVEGLETVVEKVKSCAAQIADPERLLSDIRVLVETTEKQHQAIQDTVGNPPTYDKKKNPNVFAEYGRSEGFRKAVVVLRWFLNES